MRHVTRMNESCRMHEWVMSNIGMSSVVCHIQSVMSRTISHVTHVSESGHTQWVMSRMRISHVLQMSQMNQSYQRVLSRTCHMWMSQVTDMNESCHLQFLGVQPEYTNVYMSHVTHIRWSYHVHEWVMAHLWMSQVTQSFWVLSRSYWYPNIYLRHVRSIGIPIYTWDMSHACVSPVTCMNESFHMYEWGMSRAWISHVTCMNTSCHMHE